MELKPIFNKTYCNNRFAFNQTRMELKLVSFRVPRVAESAFNQTRMELKRYSKAQGSHNRIPFNQTRMELKRVLLLVSLSTLMRF